MTTSMHETRQPSLPAPRPKGGPRPQRHYWLRRAVAAMLAVATFLVLFVIVSLVAALRTPGNESFNAKWADWMRSHDAAFIVNRFENYYYAHNQPKKGGTVGRVNHVPLRAGGPTHAAGTVPHLAPPSPVPLVVQPAAPGEGTWTPTFAQVHGIPAMYATSFRADTIYTSQLASAVWIDTKLLRVNLNPGATEPGGSWTQPPYITSAQLPTAVAAFNGGFRFQDANGGFYAEGRQAVPLRNGAASIVLYADGRVDVGVWGRDDTMGPGVVGVLQNRTLLVDGGQIDPNVKHNDTHAWGNTLKGSIAVARSGVGVTRDGALVYVAGPALTARSLAESLQRAGAIRAMTLDINPEWVTFNYFENPTGSTDLAAIQSVKLYPQQQRSSRRYLGPEHESRDFFTISLPAR